MHQPEILEKVRVWDLPTRAFHWSLVLCTLGLAVSGLTGGTAVMDWHMRLGYAVLALLLFRIIWGLVGGRWSRFAAFVYAPRSIIDYLMGKGKPEHDVGHSPIGAISVFAMLAVLVAQVASGLMSDDEIASSGPLTSLVSNATVSLASNYHANIGKWLLLALVCLHVSAVIFYQLRKKKSLVGAMLHGDKTLPMAAPSSRDDIASRTAALLIFSTCGALVYWALTLVQQPAF